MGKYTMPLTLAGQCDPAIYERWLQRKAKAHVVRDRGRGNPACSAAAYKAAIHAAVERQGDRDYYTGAKLRWDLISQYDNDASTANGRAYKRTFADLPTVDHIYDGLGEPRFAICSWRTNDAKSDLSYAEFVELCRAVASWHEKHGTDIAAHAS